MKASRKRPKGAFRRPFGLVLCVMTAMPNSVGHQDLAALIARQPAVTERWRSHVRATSFGTIHAASLSFPRLAGASIPDPYFTQLAALDPRALEATGSIPLNVPIEPEVVMPVYDFPVVDRRLKGDRLKLKSAPSELQELDRREQLRPKSKDMAGRPPTSAPLQRDALSAPSAETGSLAALPKGDRLAPVQERTAEAAPAEIHRRAGLVSGQETLAKRILGAGPRQRMAAATPSEPAKDHVLRRAGIVAGANTLAKRVLGAGPRQPTEIAAPAESAAERMNVRRPGLAAAHLNAVRAEARRAGALVETADLESQRADLYGPIVPPVASATEVTAEPAAPEVAEVMTVPAAEEPTSQPQVADVAPEPVPQVADVAPEPASQVAERESESVSEPEPDPVAVEQQAPAVADVAPAATEKTANGFNTHPVDKLAQFAKPSAQTRVFFGTRELGIGRNTWEAWEPDEAPTVLAPPHVDTEIKQTARDPQPDTDVEQGGETIAPKGEVTGEGKRPRTPAERLNLTGASRAKHQKCLANAIYFEARGEVERGQMAVAQVVLNRAFSGYYPGNVCDVVYQNAHRHLACQFTFACDNHRDVVRDQRRWEIADRIASDALDGKFWLPEIGKATHYHATYVNPWWVRTMTKHSRIGVHIFYRPTRWGSLDEIPVWGERLEATGSIKREAPASKSDDKRADARAATPARRSIFDPVEPIDLPGG